MLVPRSFILLIGVLCIVAFESEVRSEVAVIDFTCESCGHKIRLIQGSDAIDQAHNVQSIIVVCERNHKIRNIKVPIDPRLPTPEEPLVARRYGNGRSELLGVELPRFLIPGNTCPLFPVTAYLDANICPIDGRPGFRMSVVGEY